MGNIRGHLAWFEPMREEVVRAVPRCQGCPKHIPNCARLHVRGTAIGSTNPMKAVVFERNGGFEVLQYKDIPEPKPGPNEVVIKVKASACNFNDIWARRGLPGMKILLPHISGSDAA